MDSIRQYILSVICMVIVCGITQLLFPSGTTASILKLLCGLIVTITVLSPLFQDKIIQWDVMFEGISADGKQAITDGERAAENTLSQLIKEKTQAYILTKASQMGADITVDIQLQKEYPNAPQSVVVKGVVSPYVKEQLADCISLDLGIAEEDQVWIS